MRGFFRSLLTVFVVVVIAKLGLPIWLLLVTLLVIGFLLFVVEFAKLLGAAMVRVAEVPLGEVACPRCTESPRAPSGWCPACTDELERSRTNATDPVDGFERALRAGDLNRAAQFLAEEITIEGEGDSLMRVVTRAHWRRTTKIFVAFYPTGEASNEVSYGDPDDPSVLWLRKRGSAEGRFRLPSVEFRRVLLYRVSDSLISEIRGTPALPSEGA